MPQDDRSEAVYDDHHVEATCLNPEGVDRTLILAALDLTVEERVAQFEQWVAAMCELRDAYETTRAR